MPGFRLLRAFTPGVGYERAIACFRIDIKLSTPREMAAGAENGIGSCPRSIPPLRAPWPSPRLSESDNQIRREGEHRPLGAVIDRLGTRRVVEADLRAEDELVVEEMGPAERVFEVGRLVPEPLALEVGEDVAPQYDPAFVARLVGRVVDEAQAKLEESHAGGSQPTATPTSSEAKTPSTRSGP